MPAAEQNLNPNRYQIIPRVLIFVWRGESLLLLKIRGKGRWDGRYNGLGGHIERAETALDAADRELFEESGLQADLRFVGSLLIDTGESPGIGLFIFNGEAAEGQLVASEEGDLAWIPLADLENVPLLEDVPILLRKIRAMGADAEPFFARSFYDAGGNLELVFAG
ncbi:MAG: NUDIX domain-containing protein [Anaerolineales bacterium]|jgi:8-oxo-dGTP pyrophosphatase MutT (NUDIX family)|nr:NUDIX domain-containing protein [Anaerolineales bacterium]